MAPPGEIGKCPCGEKRSNETAWRTVVLRFPGSSAPLDFTIMVYSQALADRVRHALRSERGIGEKKMFGGIGFLRHGNMLVGIWQSSLIARIGADQEAAALQQQHVRPFDVTGRPMKGWVMVDPDGLDRDQQVAEWIERALRFVETLPPK